MGRPLGAVFPEMPEPGDDEAALTVADLTAGPLREVSLTVRRGEVVGIAGLARHRPHHAAPGDLR